MQQTQTNIFLASNHILREMPYLCGLFEAIDDLIIGCAVANDADLTQLKRFVAGHVARDDLEEFKGSFHQLGEQKKAPRDWNALMGIALTQQKRARIDTETVACAHQLQQQLNGDDQARAEKLRAEVEAKKKELLEKNEEKTRKMNDADKSKPNSYRLRQYKIDLDKLYANMAYMCENYGSHMILAVANQNRHQQMNYPPFTTGNSGKNELF